MATDLARSWLVISMMGSATALGGLLMATAIPGLFLILHGGVLVDRVDVRRLMIWTKAGLAVIAVALAAMVEWGHIQYWHLLVFGLLEGLVTAFDAPTFQALTVRMVPRAEFQQALALNSMNFHASRMLGPLIAGGLLAVHGPSLVFLFDGLTYLVLVLTLSRLKITPLTRATKTITSQWQALGDGLRYMAKTPRIRFKILQLLLTISLVFPLLLVVFRTYIKTRFDLDAQEFGFILTLPALGSMTGALSFAVFQPKVPIRPLLAGVPGATLMILLIPLMPTPMTAALISACAGFFMYLTFASITVSVQLEVLEDFRGRVSSVIGLCFVSIGPLMGLPMGSLADRIGFAPSIYSVTGFFFVCSAGLAWLHRHARHQPT